MERINNNNFSEKLNIIFEENINFSFVSIESVIIVTKLEDKCYEFKRNRLKNLLLAFSDNDSKVHSLKEESFVKELSCIGVVDIQNFAVYSMVRTIEGKVYILDKYKVGVSANKRDDWKAYKPQLNQLSINEKVIDMCCGYFHTIMLMESGDVFAWGMKNLENLPPNLTDPITNIDPSSPLFPIKLSAFNGKKLKAISCGSAHSLALTESGRVYSWGWNGMGQLGIGSEDYYYPPKIVRLSKRLVFKKISCSLVYSIFLSFDGDIYVCGGNSRGELGVNGPEDIFTPKKLYHSEKFIDIASHSHWPLFAAVSEKSVFYIWGYYKNVVITSLKEAEFRSFSDIFSNYLGITYQPEKGRVIRFNDDFIQNGKYKSYFPKKRKFGKGSNGKVFKVNSKDDENMKYAIKIIKFNDFLKELETSPIIYELNHKNIVKYFDMWIENDFKIKNGIETGLSNFRLYIQMELCEKSLEEIIHDIKKDSNFYLNETFTPLGYYIASEVFIEILEGVNYLHKQNPPIIHRDLNPWNIMLKIENQNISNSGKVTFRHSTDKYGDQNYIENKRQFMPSVLIEGLAVNNETIVDESFVRIIDLGLATIHEHVNQSHTQDIGNPKYLAPEVQNGTQYNTRADIYNLGKILNELLLIDVERDYKNQTDSQSEKFLLDKYLEIRDLCNKMTQTCVNDRPVNIEAILEKKHLWALNVNEFDSKEEFKRIYNSYESKDSSVFKLLKRRLLLFFKQSHSMSLNPSDKEPNTSSKSE